MIVPYLDILVHWWPIAAAICAMVGGWLVFGEKMLKVGDAWKKFRKSNQELREARLKADLVQRESDILQALSAIQTMSDVLKRRHGALLELQPVKPARGEDPEIIAEAWRRFVDRRELSAPREDDPSRWNWRYKGTPGGAIDEGGKAHGVPFWKRFLGK
jgi:ABC-type protease/lipase transport system fused ATPase/permease subunit